MTSKILMNVQDGDECRVALTEDGLLHEYFVDRPTQLTHVGDVYRGVVSNIEGAIQAAFIDIGFKKNAFLHISDTLFAYNPSVRPSDIYGTSPVEVIPVEELDFTHEHDIDEEDDEGDDDLADEAEPRVKPSTVDANAEDEPVDAEVQAVPSVDEDNDEVLATEANGDISAPPIVAKEPFMRSRDEAGIAETVNLEREEALKGSESAPERRKRKRGGRRVREREEARARRQAASQEATSDPSTPQTPSDTKAPQKATNTPASAKPFVVMPATSSQSFTAEVSAEDAVDQDESDSSEPRVKAPKKKTSRKSDRVVLTVATPVAAMPTVATSTPAEPAEPAEPATARKVTKKTAKKAAKKVAKKTATKMASVATSKPSAKVTKVAKTAKKTVKKVAKKVAKKAANKSASTKNSQWIANPFEADIFGSAPATDGFKNGRPARFRKRELPPMPMMQTTLSRGQEVLCQVTRAAQGGKGPSVTTYISLPGRYMVLMPNTSKCGVSRKISDRKTRNDLRRALRRLHIPSGMGVIIRTAAADRPIEELQRDLNYLLKMWNGVLEDINIGRRAPTCCYRDSDPAIRTVRDYFHEGIDEILIDDEAVYHRVRDFFLDLMPDYADRVKFYDEDVPLFAAEGIEPQIEHLFDKKVNMPSGGYLFIEQTEALVAIDINSGRFTSETNAESTAYKTNMEAIPEIVRQLRLRDLGGIVVCDFIDMMEPRHRRDVENRLKTELRRDRARVKVAQTSPFGLVEMTRQRVRQSIRSYLYNECHVCHGFGHIKSDETLALRLLRAMRLVLAEDYSHGVVAQAAPPVLSYLHTHLRADIATMQAEYDKTISFEWAPSLEPEELRLFYVNHRGDQTTYDYEAEVKRFASEVQIAGVATSAHGRKRRRRKKKGEGDDSAADQRGSNDRKDPAGRRQTPEPRRESSPRSESGDRRDNSERRDPRPDGRQGRRGERPEKREGDDRRGGRSNRHSDPANDTDASTYPAAAAEVAADDGSFENDDLKVTTVANAPRRQHPRAGAKPHVDVEAGLRKADTGRDVAANPDDGDEEQPQEFDADGLPIRDRRAGRGRRGRRVGRGRKRREEEGAGSPQEGGRRYKPSIDSGEEMPPELLAPPPEKEEEYDEEEDNRFNVLPPEPADEDEDEHESDEPAPGNELRPPRGRKHRRGGKKRRPSGGGDSRRRDRR